MTTVAIGACTSTGSSVSADASATTPLWPVTAGSASTFVGAPTPTPTPGPTSAGPSTTRANELIDGGTLPATSITTEVIASAADSATSSTLGSEASAPLTPEVLTAPAGAGPVAPLPTATLPPIPPPPPSPDGEGLDDRVPSRPIEVTTPSAVLSSAPTVYDAGTVSEVWVCDGQPDEPRTGFAFVRNPADAQQVFIEVAARAWSTDEIVGSLMAAQASINDGRVLATGPFDPSTGQGIRAETGDPVGFALTANLLTVTERPDESVPVVWSCRAVTTA